MRFVKQPRCRAHRHPQRPALTSLAMVLLVYVHPFTQAAPAAAHWTVDDLGGITGNLASYINNNGVVAGNAVFGGSQALRPFVRANGQLSDLSAPNSFSTTVTGINDAGQVVGGFTTKDDVANQRYGINHPFIYSQGRMTDLYGVLDVRGISAINTAGQLVGTNHEGHAYLYGEGQITDLGTLGGWSSHAAAISGSGLVTGTAMPAVGFQHAFLYSKGQMQDLGTLDKAADSLSDGYAINDAGQVTGISSLHVGDHSELHAFLYDNASGMVDLGTLGGQVSVGRAINRAGAVVGQSHVDDVHPHAFLYSQGVMRDLNTFAGIAGKGYLLNDATGINDLGQIVGTGTSWAGPAHPYLATLDTVVWEATSGGSWADAANWSYGIGPNKHTAVYLDPLSRLLVKGPAGAVTVRTLNIGGDASGNPGAATLQLAGGTITVLGEAGRQTTVSAKGVLSGQGTLIGAVNNLGQLEVGQITIQGGLDNHGLLTGHGRLTADVLNHPDGNVRVYSGQTLLIDGSLRNRSGGVVDIRGGALQISQLASNEVDGAIHLDGGSASFSGSLRNAGYIQVGASGGSVSGAVGNLSGGHIIAHTGTLVLQDALNNQGEIRAEAGAKIVYRGAVQAGGQFFTTDAEALHRFEGDLLVATGAGGLVHLGHTSLAGRLQLDGLGPGQAAVLAFDGSVLFDAGSVLSLQLAAGTPLVEGEVFDLFSYSQGPQGRFGQLWLPQLGVGLRWDDSQLYSLGELRVATVPEPLPLTLWCAGLLGLALRLPRVPRSACSANPQGSPWGKGA